MHREIMGLVFGDKRFVDHINRNPLDNRRSNLLITTNRGNQENRRDQSKYGPGVRRLQDGWFSAETRIDGVIEQLGQFSTVKEARDARTKAIKEAII